MNPQIPSRVADINSQIAASPLASQGISQSANNIPLTNGSSISNLGSLNIPTTISSSSLSSDTQPISLPSIAPPSTTPAGVIGSVASKITNAQNDIQNTINTQENNARTQLADTKAGLLEKLGIKSQTVTDKAAALQTPEFLAKKQASSDAYNQLQQLDQAQRNEIAALDTQGGTAGGRAVALADITRKYALAHANLAVSYDVANRDYQSAIDSINTATQLKMDAVQPYIDYYQSLLSGDRADFTQAEQNKLQLKQNEYKTQQEDIKAVGNIMQTALTNGVNLTPQDTAKLNSFTNPNDALAYLSSRGISLQNPLDKAYKQAQINSLNAKANASGAINGGVSQELNDAINNGTIDPNRINSRTLGIYNALAKAQVDAVGSHAGAAGETKAITDLSTYKSTAVRTLGVLESNLPLVENLADKVNTIGAPLLDSYATGAKALTTNDPNVIKYVNSLRTLRAEYAQMLAKGNATTESDKAEAAKAIPAGLSSAGYAALGEQLKLEATNILQASDNAIQAAKNKSASNTGAVNTVQSNGGSYVVGQLYNDGKSNWVIDAKGNWTQQ